MAKLTLKKGLTDVTVYLFVQDSSKTTGEGLTGLAYNTANLVASYVRPLGSRTAITLATLAAVTSAHTDGGFKEIDATNMPGVYRLDLPDAVCATGVPSAVVMLKGAANMAPVLLEIQLTDFDLNSTSNPVGAADSVTAGVTVSSIANNAITANAIAANAITDAKIASNAITDAKIKDGAITANKIASNAITDAKIASNAITDAKIASGAITAAKIATDAISGAKLAEDAIFKIQNGLATPTNITGGTITTVTNLTNLPSIPANWLTADGIKSDAVSKIQNGLATPTNITGGTITTVTNLTNLPSIPADWITASGIKSDAVTKIQNGLATPTNITQASGITLADDAITAAKFDESTAFPLKSADAGATAVARVGADGNTLETLSDQIDGVKSDTGAILADTGTDGVVVGSIKANAVDADSIKSDAVTKIQNGLALDATVAKDATVSKPGIAQTIASNADITAIKAKTDQLAFTVANQVDANALTGSATAEDVRIEMDANSTKLAEILTDTGTDGVVLKASGLAADAVTKIQNGLATPTNITAGTITTVTNLTNLPAMPNDWLTAAGIAADAGAEIADAVWDEEISGHTTAGSFGAKNQKVVPSETIGDYKADVSSLATSAALATVGSNVTSIKAKTDTIPASPAAVGSPMTLTVGERTAIANEVESQIIDDTDAEKVLEAITDKIASVNPSLDDLTLAGIASAVRTELTTELARIDAAISTRLATAGYTAPANADISTIKSKTDNLPDSPAASGEYTSALVGLMTAIEGISAGSGASVADILNALLASYTVSGSVGEALGRLDNVQAKTDNLPDSPAASGEYTSALSAIQADLDNPDQYKADVSSLATSAALATVGSNVTSIKAKTDNLPASPAAVGSAMTLSDNAITAAVIATDAIDADSIKADAITEIQAGLATPTNITAGTITTVTNLTNLPAMPNDWLTAAGVKADAVTKIATAVWGHATRTLSSFGTLVSDIWSAATRTLSAFAFTVTGAKDASIDAIKAKTDLIATGTSLTIASVVSGSTITAHRGDTLSAALTNIGALTNNSKLWFTVKRDYDDADTAAVIQIEKTGGLLYLNGAAGTAGNGSLTINDEATGDVTIVLNASETAKLSPGNYQYDIQILRSAGTPVSTLTYGEFVVPADVTRATS